MLLRFCTESDPDTSNSSSNPTPVEAMGTTVWLCSCYYIMRLELFMTNWLVLTVRATAPAGSNMECIWASFSSQTVFKGLTRDPDKQYRPTKLCPLFGSTYMGEREQDLKDMQECRWNLHSLSNPGCCLLCAVGSEQSRQAKAGLHKHWILLVITLDDKTLPIFLFWRK